MRTGEGFPDRRWLVVLPWIVGLTLVGLMGWGIFSGVSALVRAAQPERQGESSIALSAGFARPREAASAPAAPAAEAAQVFSAPATPPGAEAAVPAGGAGAAAAPAAGAEEKTAPKEKPKAKKEAPLPVFEIRGSVQQAGRSVQGGKVKLTVSLVGERFRQSVLAAIERNGDFLVHDHPAFQILEEGDRIRVVAEVWPASRPSAGIDEPLTETVYLNHHLPSWIRSSTGYGLLGGVLLFAALFLWAFTGHSTYGKNRLAIILSYTVIFLSLAGALVGPTLLMLAVPDLPELSGKVPVGLVVAHMKDAPNPQWMLNIGGYVETDEKGKGALFGGAGAATEGVKRMKTPVARPVTLNGGIQIPLYVILLALIGGAINMTRQVPGFQSRQPVETSLLHRMGWARARVPDPAEEQQRDKDERENHHWRKGLLDQYMFLVAAPFLAIATYYLLILLGTIQPPIIVLVCFSIGLISDTVVTAITKAAEKLLGGKPIKDEPDARASSPKRRQDVPEDAQPQAQPNQPTEAADPDDEDAEQPKKVA